MLAAILAVAGASDTVGEGAFLLIDLFARPGHPFPCRRLLRAALPLLAAGVSGAILPVVEKGMGAFLVLTGIAFLSGQMATVSYWMLETFPGLATLG